MLSLYIADHASQNSKIFKSSALRSSASVVAPRHRLHTILQHISAIMSQVRCAHLLIKHTGSRNPVSRRTGGQVSLSPQDALAELQSYEARIKAEGVHSAFPKYASERSDCSSFRNQGDLGFFGRDMSKLL